MTIGYETCAEGVRWCVSPGEWCGFPCMVGISYQICKVEMACAVYRYAFSWITYPLHARAVGNTLLNTIERQPEASVTAGQGVSEQTQGSGWDNEVAPPGKSRVEGQQISPHAWPNGRAREMILSGYVSRELLLYRAIFQNVLHLSCTKRHVSRHCAP